MEPILATFWTTVGSLSGPILGPKSAPEGDQKWDYFWEPLAPALRGLALTFSGIMREGWKGYWNWNYILQRRGRDLGFHVCMDFLLFEIKTSGKDFLNTGFW